VNRFISLYGQKCNVVCFRIRCFPLHLIGMNLDIWFIFGAMHIVFLSGVSFTDMVKD
jgi:hypothetical protein